MTLFLLCLAGLFVLTGHIMLLVECFSESILWGLIALFFPLALLVFVLMRWDRSKRGFVVILVGYLLCIPIIAYFNINNFAERERSHQTGQSR